MDAPAAGSIGVGVLAPITGPWLLPAVNTLGFVTELADCVGAVVVAGGVGDTLVCELAFVAPVFLDRCGAMKGTGLLLAWIVARSGAATALAVPSPFGRKGLMLGCAAQSCP